MTQPSSAAYPRRLAILAIGIGSALGLLAAEVAVRWLEPPPDTAAVPLPSDRLYGYAPGTSGLAGGAPFVINSAGFRGPDLDDIDAKQDFVIVVLGDSYAFGYGVGENETFPALLQSELSQAYPAQRVRVVNLGIPGYETPQELATLREWAPRLRPRMVLLQYHLNDVQRHAGEGPAGLSGGLASELRRHVHVTRLALPWLAALSRSLGMGLRTTATAEIDTYVRDAPAWQENRRTLQELFDTARHGGARLGVLVVPYLVDLTEHHPPAPAYRVVVQFCESQDTPVINAFDYFQGERADRLWINAFDGHPNATGQAILARAAADLVERIGGLGPRHKG